MDESSFSRRAGAGRAESSSLAELRAGSILGRYELLLPIAKGGMAQVWAARMRGTRGFQKLVAIKTILAGAIDNTRLEQMFLEEAQLAAQIHHPNVVTTLDLGEHEGTLYLVMEWVDGEALSEVMARASATGGAPLPIAVNLIGQACQGLHAAHTLRDEHGALLAVVHRDVSPQNLLVTYSGTAKLVDFGIAKATGKSSNLTEAGEVKGKFAYMAPEQVAGQAVDSRADLFSLGIILYGITTGKHPFRGSHPAETIKNTCSDKPPVPPSAIVPDYPKALEAVVMKALKKTPAARFESANQMLTALEAAMPGPLEASFEVRVADYMSGLFGERASERRAAIRVAQEQADRLRSESSSSISVGTLRAISIDGHEGTPVSSLSTGLAPLELDSVPPFKRRLSKWTLAAGGALLVVCGVGFSLLSRPAPKPAAGPVPGAASIQWPVVAPVSTPDTSIRPVVTGSSHSAAHASADTADSSGDAGNGTRARKPVPWRGLVAGRPAVSAGAGPVAASAPPVRAPPAASASARPPARPKVWDRDAFGGRF
jgi:eukaryotic-like serine/threonine-protein kinase